MDFFQIKKQEVFNRAISSLLKWKKKKNSKKYNIKKTKNFSKYQNYHLNFKKKEFTGIIKIGKNFSKKNPQTYSESMLKISNLKRKMLKEPFSIKKKYCLKTSKFRELTFYLDLLFFIFRNLI